MRVLFGKKVGCFSVKLWKEGEGKYGKITYGTYFMGLSLPKSSVWM